MPQVSCFEAVTKLTLCANRWESSFKIPAPGGATDTSPALPALGQVRRIVQVPEGRPSFETDSLFETWDSTAMGSLGFSWKPKKPPLYFRSTNKPPRLLLFCAKVGFSMPQWELRCPFQDKFQTLSALCPCAADLRIFFAHGAVINSKAGIALEM